ncbi:MAG: polysaccharide deacetylase family protein [Candidatus Hydrogenedentota bacterium]
MKALNYIATAALVFVSALASAQTNEKTYAEKLGWEKGTKALIIHVDDAGMSHDSNVGTIKATVEGLANSFSVMIPCPWVPEIVEYIKKNPGVDAGLHLTLNAEWDGYRWGPVAGKPTVPGLIDSEGAMWRQSSEVVENATADEVETEIRAQIDRARTMGFEPTHLDSHMGTIFENPEFITRYVKVGVELQIPIMVPGGAGKYTMRQYSDFPRPMILAMGKQIWDGGLPVLDDLHNTSYGWKREDKVAKYAEAFRGLEPGVTMIIMHCTSPSDTFPVITGSTQTRLGDLEAMLDPSLKKVIEDEGIVLTTFRELKERRDALKK